jgi:serine/threonine-protein phosphatase 2A regulatory subunit B
VSLSKENIIKIPDSVCVSEDWETMHRKSFDNGHNYHIHSLSQAADGEHFLSADDLRVNVWNLETNKTTFSIVDFKAPNIDDLTEVITHAEFHP